MTSSNGNIFRVTGLLCEEFTGHRWIPRTKASDANFDIFFELRLNKQLSKQSWDWWFETPSCSLWHQCNGYETTWQHAVYLVNDVTIYFCDFDIYCLALKRFSQMYQLRRYILLLLHHFWLLLILSLMKKNSCMFLPCFHHNLLEKLHDYVPYPFSGFMPKLYTLNATNCGFLFFHVWEEFCVNFTLL